MLTQPLLSLIRFTDRQQAPTWKLYASSPKGVAVVAIATIGGRGKHGRVEPNSYKADHRTGFKDRKDERCS